MGKDVSDLIANALSNAAREASKGVNQDALARGGTSRGARCWG